MGAMKLHSFFMFSYSKVYALQRFDISYYSYGNNLKPKLAECHVIKKIQIFRKN